MKECLRCGNMVTERYHRVNSNNRDELCSCPRCTPNGEQLTAEGEESESSVYERYLDDIRNDMDVPMLDN